MHPRMTQMISTPYHLNQTRTMSPSVRTTPNQTPSGNGGNLYNSWNYY